MGIDSDIQRRGQVLVKAMDDLKTYLNSHGTSISAEGGNARFDAVAVGLEELRIAISIRDQWRRQGDG